MLAQPAVHIHEDYALLLQILAQAVVHHLGLVLSADARQELSLRFRNTETVESRLDVCRHVIPGTTLIFHRLDVIEDVLEVDLVDVPAPLRHLLLFEGSMGAEAAVALPLALARRPAS